MQGKKLATLKFKEHIENLFRNSQKFSDSDGNLDVNAILEAIDKIDIELIKILKDDTQAKEKFFVKVDDVYILEQNKLLEFFTQNDYMKNGSYTSYTNKIGLIKKDNFIKKFDDVVLAWPHKDCILEGGQTKDDDKNKEVFYNEILSSDEIDRLFEPKVLTNVKRYTKDGVEENSIIKDDDNLIIKGNNLLALHSLKKKYAGKVKLIYIDPPYNTGNDSFNYNDNFNHSTWLTFMKNRFEIARELLSEEGSVYVQLDYNEAHYCKVLLDEIFGIENFQREIIWDISVLSGYKTIANNWVRGHDTILFYSKNHKSLKFKKVRTQHSEKYLERFNKIEEGTGRAYFDGRGEKKYLDDVIKKGKAIGDVWNDIISFQQAATSKERIKDFDGQKPENLLERIILSATDENDIVLDYHLGTGTTCATAHKMGRQYIGIEQMDYIEDIAVERMKNVINGEQSGISKEFNWQGGGEFIYAELKEINNFQESEIGKLNKTMKYLPISEMEDEEYGISKEEIAINKAFYGVENE